MVKEEPYITDDVSSNVATFLSSDHFLWAKTEPIDNDGSKDKNMDQIVYETDQTEASEVDVTDTIQTETTEFDENDIEKIETTLEDENDTDQIDTNMEDDNDSNPTQTTVIDEYETAHTEIADVDENGNDQTEAAVEDENVIDDMEVVYVTVDIPDGDAIEHDPFSHVGGGQDLSMVKEEPSITDDESSNVATFLSSDHFLLAKTEPIDNDRSEDKNMDQIVYENDKVEVEVIIRKLYFNTTKETLTAYFGKRM